ncbi:MAG: lipopolysaccharide kinase InaA family protein, partial [Pseudomonadota bacterium]
MYIPENLKQYPQHYALGKYIIHHEYKNNKNLEDWIKNLTFEQSEIDYNRMQMHSRKRNNLYSFDLPAVGKEVVLKVSQISDNYKWYRRLNLFLVSLFKDYSLNAYYGGIALEKIGVLTPKIIAHWDCKRQGKSKKSYLMYEKANTHMTAFSLCDELLKTKSDSIPIIQEIAKQLAMTVRDIHKHNIRHGDPHGGNFLLATDTNNIKTLTLEDCKHLSFYLIDLDKTSFSDKEKPWKKKILDIRCMR